MDSPQVGNWSEGMFKFVVIISYYKIEFLPQLFGRPAMSQSFCKEYLQRNSLQIADWPAIEKESVKLVKYIASELDSTNPR